MNRFAVLLVGALSVCACKRPGPSADAGVAHSRGAQLGGARPMPGGACGELLPATGLPEGLEGFRGFSADGQRFAFAVYSQGAGAAVLSVVEPPSTVIQKFLLDSPQATAEARAVLQDGGFSGSRRLPPGWEVLPTGGGVGVIADGGVVVYSGTPFGGLGGGGLKARLWGCDPSGRWLALEVSQQTGTEFGAATTYVLFSPAGADR